MAVYRLAYDMNVPGERRQRIDQYIRATFSFCKISETDYLIQASDLSADSLWNSHLARFFDTSDRALLIQCMRNYQGILTQEQWNWIYGAQF